MIFVMQCVILHAMYTNKRCFFSLYIILLLNKRVNMSTLVIDRRLPYWDGKLEIEHHFNFNLSFILAYYLKVRNVSIFFFSFKEHVVTCLWKFFRGFFCLLYLKLISFQFKCSWQCNLLILLFFIRHFKNALCYIRF